MDIRISISIIAILAILFGTTITTTTTNSAWSQTGRDIEMDSQKCVNNNVDSEIAFSWKGYPATDNLEILILDIQDNKIVASETIKPTVLTPVQGLSYLMVQNYMSLTKSRSSTMLKSWRKKIRFRFSAVVCPKNTKNRVHVTVSSLFTKEIVYFI